MGVWKKRPLKQPSTRLRNFYKRRSKNLNPYGQEQLDEGDRGYYQRSVYGLECWCAFYAAGTAN